ncbi:S24 family peptidase [Dentiradicibacter hellwigii]|uniref:S24 family peptidase n=1 Tax=Dentiradicibacter hellwigii TaxID=3149053 RepID=A0ABV4UKW5_9RHOO
MRLKEARARLGLSQKDAAEQSGVSARGYQGYEDGRSIPGGDAIAGLVRLGINANWLLTGEGEMFNAPRHQPAPKIQADTPYQAGAATVLSVQEATASGRYIALPLHNDVRAAAGHGAVVGSEEADDSLMFREDWIKHELRMQPKDLVLIRVAGESMLPTLRDGDVILINQSLTQPDTDGIYIMRMGDMLLVKRLQLLPGGQISVISDNPTYRPWTLDISKMAEGDVAIIGRVVWAGTRF